MSRTPRRPGLAAFLAAPLLLLAACGGSDSPAASGNGPNDGHYPVTVRNCGHEITFDAPPKRVLMLRSNQVEYLSSLGVLDRVMGKAGAFPKVYYDDETNRQIDAIPSLSDQLDGRGHVQISKESIIGQQPDLVLGLPDGITQEGLADVGIPSLLEPAYCPKGLDAPGFDDVYAEMRMFGKVFDREKQAEQAVRDLRRRVTAVQDSMDTGHGRSAAVLYPTVGGGVLKAYGTKSMAQPQLTAAGFDNVFDDVRERLFEVTLEELIDRDPDIVILLHVSGAPGPVRKALTQLPGASELRAVRDDQVMVQWFNFIEPPTPLALKGLEQLRDRFGGGTQ